MSARGAGTFWLAWLAAAVLLALLVTAGIAWWRGSHVRIERRVPLPPRGEAAYNPLYLLREALHSAGVEAQARQRLQLDTIPLAAHDTVLILGDPYLLSADEVERLLAWVTRGGHLVVSAAFLADHADRRARADVLGELGIRRHPAPPAGCSGDAAPDDLNPVFCAVARFAVTGAPPALALGNPADGYAFTRLARGNGVVDVFATLDFLTNRPLPMPPRAALAWQLLASNDRHGTVHLVYAAQVPPLWQWLFERARMAWVPLLLALAAWLWLRMPRVGPLRPAPLSARRALLEHISASGEHLYRYRRTDVLHTALRDAVLARLARRDPLVAALAGAAQHQAIAARTGIPVQAVAAALCHSPRSAQEFLARMTCLHQMRLKL